MKYFSVNKKIMGIPFLEYEIKNKVSPLIIFVHGLTRSKEDIKTVADKIVKSGYNIISIDAYLHGERKKNVNVEEMYPYIVINTSLDIFYLYKDYIRKKRNIDLDNIFVIGVSMGGAITVLTSSLTNFKGYVSIIGSPSLVDFLKVETGKKGIQIPQKELAYFTMLDPYYNLNKYCNKNILFQNGIYDKQVSAVYAQNFYNKIKNKGNVNFQLYKVDHTVNKKMLQDCLSWVKNKTS